MKKNLKQLVMVLILAIMIFPASVRAEGNNCFGDDLKGADQEAFSTLNINDVDCSKYNNNSGNFCSKNCKQLNICTRIV